MTRVLCLNNAGVRDRLTVDAFYLVVGARRGFVEVTDNKGERTTFLATRFTPVPKDAREELKVAYP